MDPVIQHHCLDAGTIIIVPNCVIVKHRNAFFQYGVSVYVSFTLECQL